MAAAITARRHGLDVTVVDDQPTPGGQIWRSVELAGRRDGILGTSFSEGRAVAEAFRTCGASYLPGSQLWQIEPGFRSFVTKERQPQVVESQAIVLATGALERPVPFRGWTLPGVLTVGAAQILLKNAGQVPDGPVWVAGSGPLPLLYLTQLLRAGGRVDGYLDTTPPGQWRSALRYLPGAIRGLGDLAKGLGWITSLRKSKMQVVKGVIDIEALGDNQIDRLRYSTAAGSTGLVEAKMLLVHEGVVPNIHSALSLDCEVKWNSAQDCYVPKVDEWGESSRDNIFIAGDGAGIVGAKAAQLQGELSALRIAEKLGRLSHQGAREFAAPVRRKLNHHLAMRPFLDALFKPRSQVFAPSNETIVCRCEEVTAGQIKELAKVGRPGPNQIKAATRAGMGPCQGRECGYTVTRLLSAAQHRSPNDVGFFHIRPPLKPITLGELAALNGVESP